MRDCADFENRTIGADRSSRRLRETDVHVVVREGMSDLQCADILAAGRITTDIDQAGLNHRAAGRRNRVVATENDVGFEHMIIAENILNAIDLNERAKRAAAAVAISQIAAPAAGRAKLDRERLRAGVRRAGSGNRSAASGATATAIAA